MREINYNTPDGVQDAMLFVPEGKAISPLIILFMDAFGLRASLFSFAERLTGCGFSVAIPNLYYRFGEFPPFYPLTAFIEPNERERIMKMIQSLKIASVMSDTDFLIKRLAMEPGIDINSIGTLGYCMGGKFALVTAASFPGKVKAAASIHGGNLVSDQPDSPHLMSPEIKAKVYVGIATNDRSFTDEQKMILEEAFISANVEARLEVYPGALHGFAVPDMATYNREASELHWERILKLFGESLSDQKAV
jgi:carboxymethylenebutenolidase